MLSGPVLTATYRFWASFLGCLEVDLANREIHVAPHAGLAGYRGMWAFRLGDSCILSVPPEQVEAIKIKAAGASPQSIYDPASLVRIAEPSKVATVIGPCYVGYVETSTFQVDLSRPVRAIDDPAADTRIAELKIACGADWEIGGIELSQPIFGSFDEGTLVAAASYEVWGGIIAHLCVVTAPGHRGRGFGKAASAAATSDAFKRGLIPQWRTLQSNDASLALARSLGFEQLASHYALRFQT
jgi:GNAT superfamily N-acetyltransferase